MGSGKKFRISHHFSRYWSLGVAMSLRSEHEVSIHISLVFLTIYVGIGKGYEEFEQ